MIKFVRKLMTTNGLKLPNDTCTLAKETRVVKLEELQKEYKIR